MTSLTFYIIAEDKFHKFFIQFIFKWVMYILNIENSIDILEITKHLNNFICCILSINRYNDKHTT